MNNFLFSLNVTMPIFLVMVIGYYLKRKQVLNSQFVTVANKLNFTITLPVMLFQDLSGVDIKAVFDVKYVLFCAVTSSIGFFVIWGFSRKFLKDSSLRGAFVQASFRSSAAVMGLAFIDNIYGSSAMGPLMIVGAVPLYNIYSVLVLTLESKEQQECSMGVKLKKAGLNIVTNPIIIAIFLGMVVAYFSLDFPVVLDKTMDNIARIATPLALLAMGAGFQGKEALLKIKPTLAASAIKLVFLGAVFIPIAARMGFFGEKMVAILIMLAAPATPSCYIMAKNMNNDGELTASIVVATTLLSAFTLTGWIFLLKTLGWI